VLVDPGTLLTRHQLARCDVLDDPRRTPRGRPVLARHGGSRAMECVRNRLDVHPRVVRENQPDLRAPFQWHELSKLREKCGERRLRRGGTAVLPDRADKLVATCAPLAVEDEIREQQPPLPPPQLGLDALSVELDREVSTQVDAGRQARTLFLAGDAVQLLREPVLDSLVGLGTGSLRESYDALRKGDARWYVSGMSSKARGFEPNGVAEAVMPAKLVELSFEADRVLSY
jgi:hypothetical protein